MLESEELVELENVADDELETFEEADTSLLSLSPVRSWCSNYRSSPIPCIVLDKRLNIIWQNMAYTKLFREEISSYIKNFAKIYYEYLGEETIHDIYRALHSKDAGYSWHGKIEKRHRDHPTIITNVMFVPIMETGAQKKDPDAFAAIFTDITKETRVMLKNMFQSLLEASMLKDNDTGHHINRVNRYSRKMAEELFSRRDRDEVTWDFIEDIGFLAAMHDVGKIGTPDDILNKNGKLESWEWEIMKEHTINGAYILSTYPNPMAKDIALFHHEWWDGSGYPYGLIMENIPLASRIVAVADVYDALRMKRAYKEPYSHEVALEKIQDSSGTHFDPDMVNLFLRINKSFEAIYKELQDS
ncbi:MAG: HD-GYP domain-containing protein [Spirochaetia bacterium]